MTETQTYLYQLGFIQTQPGYFETPLYKGLLALTSDVDERRITYYSALGDELTEVGRSEVGDNNTDFTFTNNLISKLPSYFGVNKAGELI